jgi:3'-phosphoadenosine 5'-phosphosulfate sulfotransferase (PAPS reductase)/FAD synthetase
MKLLQLSGGIDSLVCLLLLKDEPGLNVLTVQTDGGYPSVESYLAKLAEAFPHIPFHIRRSERRLKEYGQPVDVVPLRWTAMGQLIRARDDVRYQDTFSCCYRGIWLPLSKASHELGATVVYRGQRNDDRLKGPLVDGDTVEGITYRFPIATWTRTMVLKYIGEHAPELLPPGYGKGELSSRDCIDCTAYLQDNEQRIKNLPIDTYKHVDTILKQWRRDVLEELGA